MQNNVTNRSPCDRTESLDELSFPNALIKAGGRRVYNSIKPGRNVNGVRNVIESQMNDPYVMQGINGELSMAQ
jgi:hypothetical protein